MPLASCTVASMGPRSRERGKLSIARPRSISYFTLQRGRVHNERGRKSDPATSSRPRLMASMGPRSYERGKETTDVVNTVQDHHASMGPRSYERGKVPLCYRRVLIAHLLASMGPRSYERGKCDEVRLFRRHRASMGPRSYARAAIE